MTVSDAHDSSPTCVTIEIDQLDDSDAVLVTLRTDHLPPVDPITSVVALSGCRWLEELPEVLRSIGLALVFGEVHDAHRAVAALLEDLAEL